MLVIVPHLKNINKLANRMSLIVIILDGFEKYKKVVSPSVHPKNNSVMGDTAKTTKPIYFSFF